MAYFSKNIPLSTIARRVIRMAGINSECNFRVFDLLPEWRPSPRDIQISVERRTTCSGKKSYTEFHQRFVLKLHLDGETEGFVDGKFMRFLPGEGILVFPFQPHRLTRILTPGGQVRVLANFTLPLDDHTLLAPLRNRIISLDAETIAATGELVRLSSSPDPDDRQHAITLLSDMLAALRQKILSAPTPPSRSGSGEEPLYGFIRDHYHEGMGLKEFAACFGVSATTLRRKFLSATGKSPGCAIRELRLMYAAEKLHTTRRSIRQIAEECGFSTPFAFSRAFRQHFGMAPRAFRQEGEDKSQRKS